MDNVQDTIGKLYEKTGFMQKYGGSAVFTFIVLLAYGITMSYFKVSNHLKQIRGNWVKDRCNPKYIPFAGMIQGKKGVDALEFTGDNFTGCTQTILKNIADDAVEPLEYAADGIGDIFKGIADAISDILGLVGRIRKDVGNKADSIMGRFLNTITPIVRTLIVAKDTGSKATGLLTAGVYNVFGSYLTLKSFIGSIIELAIIVLILLAAFCILMWIIPFTWPVAATFTAIFIAVAIPFAIMLVEMLRVLNVRPKRKIPATPGACFAPGTPISVFGSDDSIPIEEVKTGHQMADGSKVTSVLKIAGTGEDMFELSGVYVTGKHLIFDETHGWTHVEKHPEATSSPHRNSTYVYCICTSSKVIRINGIVFGDWDDITAQQSANASDICGHIIDKTWNDECMHTFLEGGFHEETLIDIDDGRSIPIKDIEIGHVLRFGERVTGVVTSDGTDVRGIHKYYIGEDTIIAGPNFVMEHPEFGTISSFAVQSEPAHCDALYHLLTDKSSFCVGAFRFGDFDTRLDRFTEKECEHQSATAIFYL